MKQILEFLNENSGAITAVATVILVFVTIWYARSTAIMAAIVKEQFDETIKKEQDSHKRMLLDILAETNSNLDLVTAMKNNTIPDIVKLNSDLWSVHKGYFNVVGEMTQKRTREVYLKVNEHNSLWERAIRSEHRYGDLNNRIRNTAHLKELIDSFTYLRDELTNEVKKYS